MKHVVQRWVGICILRVCTRLYRISPICLRSSKRILAENVPISQTEVPMVRNWMLKMIMMTWMKMKTEIKMTISVDDMSCAGLSQGPSIV